MLSKLVVYFKNICTVDLRSLALMRILIAITLAVDLIIRVFNIRAHYSDQGILPLEALFRYAWNQYHFSLYTTGTIWQWQLLLFVLNFICIFCLLIGYRTRLFTCLCWLFILSLHNRNPLIHQGGDDLLRLILFWAMFMPWGYYFSVDAQRNKSENSAKNYTGLAVLGYMLQVMYVYLFSAFLKNSAEWNSEYTALYYALSFDQIVLPFGKWLYQFSGFLRMMTAAVYYTEFYVPFLLLIPVGTKYFRIIFIVVMLGLHVGISISLNVSIFPLIAVTAMAALIPGSLFENRKIAQAISNIGRNLKFFGNIHTRELPKPSESFLIKNVMVFFIFYVLAWNLTTLGKKPFLSTGNLEWIGHLLRVDQHWGMFAPAVFKDDGWFVFEGELDNKKKIDPVSGKAHTPAVRPAGMQPFFRSDRWRKYSENFLFVVNGHYRPYFCFYLIHSWNRKNEQTKMRALKIFYVKEVSLPNYQTGKPLKEELCSCELYPAKK